MEINLNDKNCIAHLEMGNANMELFLKYDKELKIALEGNERRYWHSISVALTAVNLADIYGADKDNCLVSGLLHDYCKNMTLNELFDNCDKYSVNLSDEDRKADGCIHGFLAAKMCKDKFDINDEVYNAIYYHTCGRPNMTPLEKIIYIADFIEPLRRFRDKVSDIRKMAYSDIDSAIVAASEASISFLVKREKFIHSNTLKTLDYYKDIISKRGK